MTGEQYLEFLLCMDTRWRRDWLSTAIDWAKSNRMESAPIFAPDGELLLKMKMTDSEGGFYATTEPLRPRSKTKNAPAESTEDYTARAKKALSLAVQTARRERIQAFTRRTMVYGKAA